MRKRLLLLITLSLLIALPSATVFASDLSDAQYWGTITISNNSTATGNVSAVLTLSSADLVSQGWVDSDFDNCAIRNAAGADVVFGPSVNASYPWCLWVPSIGANTNINYTLYTGNDSLSSTKYWFPGDGGMTVDDDASLEPSDNFSCQWSGWFDNSVSGNITSKDSALTIVGDGSGNITATAYLTNLSETLRPNAAGDETNIDNQSPGTGEHWDKVDEDSADDSATYVYPNPGVKRDLYNLSDSALTTETINSVTVWAKCHRGHADDEINLSLKSGGVVGESGNKEITVGVWTYCSETWSNPPEGGNWTASKLDALQVGIKLKYEYFYSECTQLYVVVDYSPVATVTASGISSGEQIGRVWADSPDLHISINGVQSDNASLSGASIIDNDNNWSICSGGCMLYVESVSVNVSGVNRMYIDWEYGTIFHDSSGNGNDATPTFRTASSDPDVSCTLVSFQPIETAKAPAYTVEEAPDFITANITVSGNFTGATVPTGGPPGTELVEGVADAGGTPRIWLWGILAGVVTVSGGLFVSYMERKHGGGGGTLLLRIGIGAAVFGVMIAFGKFDWWMMVLYLFIVLAPAMASRHGEWGGSVSQLNLIGFLAMSWVGLTMINRILEGQFIQSAETSFLNTLMFTQEFQLFGIFKVPVMNFQFFTQGIPMLLKWDYSFFGGNAQIIQYLLYSLTAVMSFIVFGFIIGLLYNYFSRIR